MSDAAKTDTPKADTPYTNINGEFVMVLSYEMPGLSREPYFWLGQPHLVVSREADKTTVVRNGLGYHLRLSDEQFRTYTWGDKWADDKAKLEADRDKALDTAAKSRAKAQGKHAASYLEKAERLEAKAATMQTEIDDLAAKLAG